MRLRDGLRRRALGLPLVLGVGPLACATPGVVPDPPAWKSPRVYELTRKAARTAKGPAPVLVVRLVNARMPTPVFRWSPIAVWAADDPGVHALPFVPTPDRELPAPARLEACAEAVVLANPARDAAREPALAAEGDALLAPLPLERQAPLPEEPCALVLRYGAAPGRSGTWLLAVTHAGVVAEQLVVEAEPAYWLLVPFSAIAETTFYAVVITVALAVASLGYYRGPG